MLLPLERVSALFGWDSARFLLADLRTIPKSRVPKVSLFWTSKCVKILLEPVNCNFRREIPPRKGFLILGQSHMPPIVGNTHWLDGFAPFKLSSHLQNPTSASLMAVLFPGGFLFQIGSAKGPFIDLFSLFGPTGGSMPRKKHKAS